MDTALEHLNESVRWKRMPMTVILCLYIIIGFLGNGVVIFIYTFRINKNIRGMKEDYDKTRYFIPSLAIFDLAALILQALSSILQNQYFVTFPTAWLCKTLWFSGWCSSVISGFILLLISLQRFLIIGFQPGKELSLNRLRTLLGIAITIAIICTSPVFYFVDIRHIQTEFENRTLITRICSLRNDDQSFSEIVYSACMLTGTLINMIACAVLYILIGRVIYTKFRKTKCKASILTFFRTCGGSISEDLSSSRDNINSEEQKTADQAKDRNCLSVSSIKAEKDDTRKTVCIIEQENCSTRGSLDECCSSEENSDKKCPTYRGVDVNCSTRESLDETYSSLEALDKSFSTTHGSLNNITKIPKKQIKRSASARRTKKGKKAKTRFTSMFLLIIAIYIISYIPPFVVQFATENSIKSILFLSAGQLNMLLFFEGTVLINHISNPFIYGYFDAAFRKEIRMLICRNN